MAIHKTAIIADNAIIPVSCTKHPQSFVIAILSYPKAEGYQKEKGYYRSSIPCSLEVIIVNHQSFGCAGKPWLTRYFLTRSKEASETDSQ